MASAAGTDATAPEIGRISLPTGDFTFEARGPATGELVLCAHGFPDQPRSFRGLARALAADGFRVVSPWMRGYSPSTPKGPFDLDRIGSDLVEIVDALSPSRRAILIGHDWGACAAYVALSRHPERFRKAVTMAVPHPAALARAVARHPVQLRRSWYMGYLNVPLVSDVGVPHADFAFIDRLWRDWSPGYTPDAASMRELKDCLARSMPAPILYYRALRGRASVRAIARVRRIEVPTLYVHGASDGCIGLDVTGGQERFFKGPFRMVVVPGAGHFTHLEAPERVEAEVRGWIGA
jgi:pimeloyl-ACP methyl ester carboxylesterase